MSRSVKGFMALVGILGLAGAFGALYYQQAHDDYLSIPEKGQAIYKNTKEPIKEFEKQMEQRIKDAKARGIDLTKEKPVKHK